MMIYLYSLLACAPPAEEGWCEDRQDDADCDGVPDDLDQCSETLEGSLTNRLGCSPEQAAGCSLQLLEPEDQAKLKGPGRFSWTGSCDIYLVQFSDHEDFPAGATQTAARLSGQELDLESDRRWWRVVGGMDGVSYGYTSPARELRWR